MNRTIALFVGVAIVSFLLGQVRAQDEGDDGPGAAPPAWTQPTKEHAELAKSAGEWTVEGEMFMAPGAPGMKFTATATRQAILGGKFVTEVFKGNFGGMPFEGHLLQGYDTLRKQYVSVWVDNSKPVMSISHGTAKDGVMTMLGEEPDRSGELKKSKQVIKTVNADEAIISFYEAGADGGQDRLTMTLHYKRKKG